MTYKTEAFWDEDSGVLRSTIVQDMTPVFDRNKALYNMHSAGNSWKGDWHHVADIPRVLVAELLRKGVNILNPDEHDEKVIRQMLNDIGYRNLRTKPGRV